MRLLPAVILLALCGPLVSLHGAELDGIQLPEQHGNLQLHGAGLLRKAWFFKIYVGALYVADPVDAGRIMEPVPKRIDIHYCRDIPKRYMIEAAVETLQQNLSKEAFENIKPQMDRLHAAFRDGKAGATASILFRPGEGLRYALDDKPIITIEDDEFANAYFMVWLGREPSSRTVKEGMLTPVERESP